MGVSATLTDEVTEAGSTRASWQHAGQNCTLEGRQRLGLVLQAWNPATQEAEAELGVWDSLGCVESSRPA